MSKRYYLSPIIGDGTMDNMFRPKIWDLNVNYISVLPVNPTNGHPLFNWALCLVNEVDHSKILEDPENIPLPDLDLDTTISSISLTKRNNLIATLSNKGIDTSKLKASTPLRQVVRTIGKHLEDTFDENSFNVVDLIGGK